MSVTGFQFITSINTINRDEETRRRVRSHARRQKLPNEPLKQTAAAAAAAARSSSSQKARTSKFRLSTAKNQPPSLPKAPSPQDDSSTSSSDTLVEEIKVEDEDGWQTEMITPEFGFTVASELPAFSILPIRTTPLTENLFKWMICVCLSPHEKFVQRWFNRCGAPTYFNTYHSSFLALSHAMNPQGNWFDSITVDPAMTHGFMGVVASMHCALSEWDDMTTIDFHRYEALKHVNKRLNQEGRNNVTVSDGVVVAVSLLVNIEAFIGSLPAARAHMMGLRKMVELRGGIADGFRHASVLQRALVWSDFAYATAAQTSLSFPFIPELASSLGVHDRFRPRSMMLNTTLPGQPPAALTIRNPEIMELFELLYSATHAVNTFEFANMQNLKTERGQMSDTIYLIEYRLCRLEEAIRARTNATARRGLFPESSPSPTSNDQNQNQVMAGYNGPNDLSDALVYASHLFLHMALRGQPPQARGHRFPLEGLMASLYEPLMSLNPLSGPLAAAASMQSPGEGAPADDSLDSWLNSVVEQAESLGSTPESPKGRRDELHEDILLWILFVGSCVQIRPLPGWDSLEADWDYRRFFHGSLKRYCLSRDMLNRDVLFTRLSRVIWLDSWCDKQLDMVWARIGNELGI